MSLVRLCAQITKLSYKNSEMYIIAAILWVKTCIHKDHQMDSNCLSISDITTFHQHSFLKWCILISLRKIDSVAKKIAIIITKHVHEKSWTSVYLAVLIMHIHPPRNRSNAPRTRDKRIQPCLEVLERNEHKLRTSTHVQQAFRTQTFFLSFVHLDRSRGYYLYEYCLRRKGWQSRSFPFRCGWVP